MSNDIDVALLTAVSLQILVGLLTSYGNVPNGLHTQALKALLHRMAAYCAGQMSGRKLVSLPTGMGKSTAIIAFIAALYRLGYSTALLVASSTVKALCDMKQSLRDLGVPDELIGVKHSKLGTSEPSTGSVSHRYQLVTHECIRRDGPSNLLLKHEGRLRAVCLYDESLFTGSASAVFLRDFRAGLAALQVCGQENAQAAVICTYLKAVEQVLDRAESELRSTDDVHCVAASFPAISPQEQQEWGNTLSTRAVNLKGYRDDLITVLDMVSRPCRVVATTQGVGLVSKMLCVPAEHYNMLVLDASGLIRELEKLDPSLHLVDRWVANIKSFEKVEVTQILTGGGRSTLEDRIWKRASNDASANPWGSNECSSFADEIISICKQRTDEDPDGGILLYLYKSRGGECMTEHLKRSMARAGLNPDEKLSSNESRFVFETWGRHEGFNGHERCTTVVLAGIQQRDHISLAGMVKAQSQNLEEVADPVTVSRMLKSEVAHAVFQAISRGSCRRVVNGVASPMKVFLLHKDIGLKDDLKPVMPDVKWSFKAPEHLPKAQDGMEDDLALRIANALAELPAAQSAISTSKLKKAMQIPTGGAMERMFSRARQTAACISQEWALQGRSFVRV